MTAGRAAGESKTKMRQDDCCVAAQDDGSGRGEAGPT